MMYKVAAVILLFMCTVWCYPDYTYEDNVEEEGGGVIESPPDFAVAESSHITVQEGHKAVIPCRLTGQTSYALMIMKEGQDNTQAITLFLDSTKVQRIPTFSRYSYAKGDMEIDNVRRSDKGTYICRLVTEDPIEVRHVLDVTYPARITSNTGGEHKVLQGSDVTLSCNTEGNPQPSITWTKEGGRLPSGAETEEGYSITLQEVDRHVEGNYICTASNGVGEAVSTVMNVIVQYTPEIITEKAIIRTEEGDTVQLVCIVHAHPPPTVSWLQNGRPVKHTHTHTGHRHTLTITAITEDTFGNYICTARNELGSTNATVHLSGHPKPPKITASSNSQDGTIHTITWETESYYPLEEFQLDYRQIKGNGSGEWIKESHPIEDTGFASFHHSYNYTFTNLHPSTNYKGVLKVKNSYAWSAVKEFVFTTTKVEAAQHPLNGAALLSASLPAYVVYLILLFYLTT